MVFTFDRHTNRYVHLSNYQLEITQKVSVVLLIHWLKPIRQHHSQCTLVSAHNILCHNSTWHYSTKQGTRLNKEAYPFWTANMSDLNRQSTLVARGMWTSCQWLYHWWEQADCSLTEAANCRRGMRHLAHNIERQWFVRIPAARQIHILHVHWLP